MTKHKEAYEDFKEVVKLDPTNIGMAIMDCTLWLC